MKKIILSTESVCDLPKALIEKYNIQVIPMHVIMHGKAFLEDEISVSDIFDYYNETKKTPTTTAKNAQEYTIFFNQIRETYPDSIIVHLGYTSKSSASFQSAHIASKDFEDLHLVDTLSVTGGLATIILKVAKHLENNPSITAEELVRYAEDVVERTKLLFAPDTLEYLKAGGRLSSVAFIGGSLLKIKPGIELKDGKLAAAKKYRGSMDSVAPKLLSDFIDQYDLEREQLTLIYSRGINESLMQEMEQKAKAEGFVDVIWVEAGPTISTHAGPGCFGVAGIVK